MSFIFLQACVASCSNVKKKLVVLEKIKYFLTGLNKKKEMC